MPRRREFPHDRDCALSLGDEYRHRGLPGSIQEDVLQIGDSLAQIAPETPGFQCAIHGDFRPSSLLVSTKNATEISSVMNWGYFESQSLPFLDLFHFMTARGPTKTWGARVVQVFKSMEAKTPSTGIVRDYAQHVGVVPELAPQFLIVYWLRQCLLRMRTDTPQLAKILQEGISVPLNYLRANGWSATGQPVEIELQVKK